jgi:hypothetical protein
VALSCQAINGRPFKPAAILKASLTLDIPLTGGLYCEKAMSLELEGVLDDADASTATHLRMKGERKIACKPDAPAQKQEPPEPTRK